MLYYPVKINFQDEFRKSMVNKLMVSPCSAFSPYRQPVELRQSFQIEMASTKPFKFISIFDYREWEQSEDCDELCCLESTDVNVLHANRCDVLPAYRGIYKIELRTDSSNGEGDHIIEWNVKADGALHLRFQNDQDGRWLLLVENGHLISEEAARTLTE
jgi:hypothetical protein